MEKQGDVYARLTLSLPSTRSVTTGQDGNSDAGFEVGKEYENSVTSVLIVLTSKDGDNYNYVASALTDTKGQTPAEGETEEGNPSKPMYTVSFESEEIAEFANQEVYVFAFCNPSMILVEDVNNLKPVKNDEGTVITAAKAVNTLVGHITGENSAQISEQNYFLMSNHSLTSVTIPPSSDLLSQYNTPENPFFLGTVDVSRVTARFDFRQTTVEGETVANRYPIYDNYTINTPVVDEDGNPVLDENNNPKYETETGKTLMGYVVLDGMALMNEANSYYCLPRVSRNGMDTSSKLCEGETSSNFVVSPGASNKVTVPLSYTFMTNNYLYNGLPTGNDVEPPYNYSFNRFTYDALSLTGHDEDNDENWTADNKTGYRIWKYVTENTIPGYDADGVTNTIKYQRLGATTCIVFRGYLEPTADSGLTEIMGDGTKYIYCYNGQLIGDLDMLKTKVAEMPVSSLADAFYAAAKANGETMNEDGSIDPSTVNMDFQKTALTERGEGLKIFKPNGGKYYCYYIYRNRHNDNGRTDLMGPMEFAVVRNNVYKIDVETINDFGHTENPNDDPDPEDPEEPDEPNKAYFRLQVRVLPWVVRVNHAIL